MRWLMVLLVGCWILIIPPSAGPDEPTHTIRAAATIRGDWSGEQMSDQSGRQRYDIPNWVGLPNPACYAFQPNVSASCLLEQVDVDPAASSVAITPGDAPIWGSVMAGLGTLLPRRLGATWAPRVFDAAIPTALVVFALSLAHRSSRMVSAAVLVALTPMAWFSIAVVNPSGQAIAAGLALSVALGIRSSQTITTGSESLLAALGWAALVLPRRDGLLWASLIVAAFILIAREDPRRMWRWLRPAEQALVAGSSLVFAVWATTASTNGSKALILTPAVIWVAWIASTFWDRSVGTRFAVVGAGLFAIPTGLFVASRIRSSGFNGRLLTLTIENTGDNLIESIGVLGWLDTVLPITVVFLWCAIVGVLAVAALFTQAGSRWLYGAALLVVVTVVSVWVLEMSIERYDGNYWQGRYSLPLLIGFPVLLGVGARVAELDVRQERRIAQVVVVGAALVTNLSLLAAVRRWGVGVDGSLWPWKWDTYDAPLPVVALLMVHVVASALLARSLLSALPSDQLLEPERQVGTT